MLDQQCIGGSVNDLPTIQEKIVFFVVVISFILLSRICNPVEYKCFKDMLKGNTVSKDC